MENDLLYRLALTHVRGIGAHRMKILLRHFGTATAIFQTAPHILAGVRGIGDTQAQAIAGFKDFRGAEKERAFLDRYKIRTIFFTDPEYPTRLTGNRDAPAALFYMGTANLNTAKIIAVIGTRTPTEYGKNILEGFIAELAHAFPELLIVSGLAYGIDAAAHRAALGNRLPTVGVLGHGLDRIYPSPHAGLSREMIKQGGLLTQFNIGTSPDDHNFPVRNRIVAAMSDAVIIAETACQGGSMLTAENALSYQKKLFAFPGRNSDHKSAGCNQLIRDGKARLLTDAGQLIQEMGWAVPPVGTQAALFQRQPVPDATLSDTALSDDEKKILQFIDEKGMIAHNELLRKHVLSHGALALAVFTLKMKKRIRSLPGGMYGRCPGSP
ncbi:MAG TPA: DNA-processing protein DprA [Puia sp.]|nr:DNA-processing protein DprA [Puia sp.]